MYFADDRSSDWSDADGSAFGRLDADALSLQIQALARQAELGGGFFHPAAALLQRELEHRAFEKLGGRGHRLIEADDDFGGIERPL